MPDKFRGQYPTVPCVEQRLEEYLDKEDRCVLEDDYWWEMQDAAADSGVDVMILVEEIPFEKWLRARRATR